MYYTAHGLDADLVSREAFRNTSAVSSRSGLPSLTIRYGCPVLVLPVPACGDHCRPPRLRSGKVKLLLCACTAVLC